MTLRYSVNFVMTTTIERLIGLAQKQFNVFFIKMIIRFAYFQQKDIIICKEIYEYSIYPYFMTILAEIN